jgi:hypothetical protein
MTIPAVFFRYLPTLLVLPIPGTNDSLPFNALLLNYYKVLNKLLASGQDRRTTAVLFVIRVAYARYLAGLRLVTPSIDVRLLPGNCTFAGLSQGPRRP